MFRGVLQCGRPTTSQTRTGHNMTSVKHAKYDNSCFLVLEILTGAAGISFLIYTLRSMLLLHEATLIHDHLYWVYPVFQFFTENVLNGHLPLWNPFSHGGEPFYPMLVQPPFLEPATFLTIYIGKWLHNNDLASLYNWVHFVHLMIMAFGVYIVFRRLADNIFVRLSLIPILLYTSFMLSPFTQGAILYQFVWVPYITYFLLAIIYHKDYRWHNWLFLAGLLGVTWRSNIFSGTWVFCLFFSLGLLLFRRDLLKELLRSRRIIPKFAVALVILFVMMLPNIVAVLEQGKFVFTGRMIDPGYEKEQPLGGPQQIEGPSLPQDHGILMPYRLITHTGTFSSIRDFIQIIYPDRNPFIVGSTPGDKWERPSEAYMYIGLLPWAIALLGFVVAKHELKPIWLIIAAGFGFLMLGPAGGLHRVLYYTYPPLWFTRHMHSYVLFFLFAVLYFYVLGFNHIFATWNTALFPSAANKKEGILDSTVDNRFGTRHLRSIAAFALFSGSMVGLVYWMTMLRFPHIYWLFLLILLIVVIGWVLRNDLGRKGIYAGLLVGHISCVLILGENDGLFFIKRSLFLLGLPLGLFLIIRTQEQLRRKTYIVALLLVVFSASLTKDLNDHLRVTDYLYCGQKHPKHAYNIETEPQKPRLIERREPGALTVFGTSAQSIRYLSLAYRRPYVLSPLLGRYEDQSIPYPHTVNDFPTALALQRWNSFFVLKTYFEVMNSALPTLALKEMFCVGKPVFQFKQAIVGMTDDEISPFLNEMGSEKAARLLDKCVIVSREDIDDSLTGFKVSPAKCEQLIIEGPGTERGREESDRFSYSVVDLDGYDSFHMDVYTETKGILYWSDGFDERWHAYVNGQEVPIYRANVNFKAIVLQEGANRIYFAFKHTLFKAALVVFFGTFGLVITIALITGCFSNRRTP